MTDSLVDQTGSRAGIKTGAGAAAWLLFDLHADVVGLETATKGAVLDSADGPPR